jgi:transglutaminase-like putative cysteine protease
MEGSIVHVTEITFQYSFTWRDGISALAAKAAVIAHTRAYLSSAAYPSGASEFMRLQAINGYICNTFQYDYRLFVESEAASTIYTAFGMITDTGAIGGYCRGVCQAYAMYAAIMLKQAGFDAITIDGTANGGGHVWNMVRTGSNWYHIDFTWDDPVSSGNPPPYTLRQTGAGLVSETYLLRTDSEISINHAWSAVQSGYRYPLTPTARHPDMLPMPDNIPTQYNPVPTATPYPTLLPTKTITQAAVSTSVSAGSSPDASQTDPGSSGQTMSGYLSSRTDPDSSSSSAAPQPILDIMESIPRVVYGIPVMTWIKGIGITIAVLALLLLIINKRRKRWR